MAMDPNSSSDEKAMIWKEDQVYFDTYLEVQKVSNIFVFFHNLTQ